MAWGAEGNSLPSQHAVWTVPASPSPSAQSPRRPGRSPLHTPEERGGRIGQAGTRSPQCLGLLLDSSVPQRTLVSVQGRPARGQEVAILGQGAYGSLRLDQPREPQGSDFPVRPGLCAPGAGWKGMEGKSALPCGGECSRH